MFGNAPLNNKPAVLMLLVTCLLCGNSSAQPNNKRPAELKFKKQILTSDFISEGVSVADVNRDGRPDVLAGAFWFESPGWIKHEITKPEKYTITGYSNSFLNYAMDINKDGWIDLIRIGLPGEAASWYENPKKERVHWKEHALFHAVGNESPALRDIDMDGIPDLVCADNINKKMVWISAPKNIKDSGWITHVISNDSVLGTHQYTHGLGFGDMNKDGREDIVIREGWWEAPPDRLSTDWAFHRANLGEESAQMYPMDLDGDGDLDVISSSAHSFGIWWFEQIQGADSITWKQHEISNSFSQTHGLAMADLNADGNPDLITGKRYYAHIGTDPGSEDPAVLYWFEYIPGKSPQWIPHKLDDHSGVGLQVLATDMNNDKRLDIVISNKNGVFVFEQLKP
jgi:hypothetical protein